MKLTRRWCEVLHVTQHGSTGPRSELCSLALSDMWFCFVDLVQQHWSTFHNIQPLTVVYSHVAIRLYSTPLCYYSKTFLQYVGFLLLCRQAFYQLSTSSDAVFSRKLWVLQSSTNLVQELCKYGALCQKLRVVIRTNLCSSAKCNVVVACRGVGLAVAGSG